jgi:hypothetical protein
LEAHACGIFEEILLPVPLAPLMPAQTKRHCFHLTQDARL